MLLKITEGTFTIFCFKVENIYLHLEILRVGWLGANQFAIKELSELI